MTRESITINTFAGAVEENTKTIWIAGPGLTLELGTSSFFDLLNCRHMREQLFQFKVGIWKKIWESKQQWEFCLIDQFCYCNNA
jgi:hypothetical protein